MRKRIYKTANGIEVKDGIKHKDSEITYYYAWYQFDEKNNQWVVISNRTLWGDPILKIECENKEEGIKISRAINKFLFHLTDDN